MLESDPSSLWEVTQAIEQSVSRNNLQMVKMLMASGWSIGNLDNAVNIACLHGHLEIFNYFNKEEGHNIVHYNPKPLYNAIQSGKLAMVKCVLDCTIFIPSDALWVAASVGNFEIFQHLFDASSENPKQAEMLQRGLCRAAEKGHVKIVKFFLDLNTIPIPHGVFHDSISNGHINVVQLFLAAGIDLNDDTMCLTYAVDHPSILQLLLQHGVNTLIDEAFLEAAKKGILESMTLLLENGAVVEYLGGTKGALFYAALNGHTKCVLCLLKAGLTVNLDASLVAAVANEHFQVVKDLLQFGANVNSRNTETLCLATSNGSLEMVRLLLSFGANIHAQNNKPLEFASEYDQMDMLILLLKENAKPTPKTLFLAVQKGHFEIFTTLIKNGGQSQSLLQFDEQLSDADYNILIYLLIHHDLYFESTSDVIKQQLHQDLANYWAPDGNGGKRLIERYKTT